jgi:ABC-type transport system substrate-binding protein
MLRKLVKIGWFIFILTLVVSIHAVPAQEITVALGTDVGSLDPRISFNVPGESQLQTMYETLVGLDPNGRVLPKLAESWEMKENPPQIKFKLRKNVKFHNGEPFTAESVKYTLESIVAPESKSPKKPFLAQIAGVDVVDPYTAIVKMKSFNRDLLRTLTLFPVMMPAKASKELGDKMATTIIGTGPYKFVEYRSGEKLVVTANPDYWGKKPQLPKITFRIIPEHGTRLVALESGEAMMINNLPIDQIDRLAKSPNIEILAAPTARVVTLAVRMDRKPLDDVRVRHALNYAINKEELIKTILGGRAQIANSPLPPMCFGADPTMKPWPYDPAKAKELLTQAGYPNGFKLKFGTPVGRFLQDKQISEAIAGYLEKVGIKTELDTPEFATYVAETMKKDGKYDIFLFAWGYQTLDPHWGFGTLYHSRFATRTAYNNPKVDELLDKARQVADEQDATKIYIEVQKIIWGDASMVWLYYQPDIIGVNKRFKGIERTHGNEIFVFNGTYLQ